MAEPNTIYKMTVLSLLSKVDFPLSNGQIVQFFLDHEYTDYFTVQQVISNLQDTELILVNQERNQTSYSISPKGVDTLSLMRDKITPAIEDDLIQYLQDNQLELKINHALTANYDKSTGGGYVVHCKYEVDGRVMVDLTMHASSASQAETMCNNWKARHEDVYMTLLDTLIQ